MPLTVIPANGHDLMVTTKHESQLGHSSVIPACFWRESIKNSLDIRLRGYDEKHFHTKAGIQKRLIFLDARSKIPPWRYFAGMTIRA